MNIEGSSSAAITPEELASIASVPRDTTTTASLPKSRDELNREGSDDTTEGFKYPSITSSMARSIGESAQFSGPRYAEENMDSLLNNSLNQGAMVKSKLRNLGNDTPQKRAQTGGRLGTSIGLAVDGPMGALLGAGVGAVAARGMGLVQSGESEDIQRKAKVIDSLKLMKVAGEDNRINFEDGGSFFVTNDPSAKLVNTSSILGPVDRTMFELDTSNPFTKRALAVARPLGRFLAEGVLGYRNDNNPRDIKAADNITSLFVNALQHNADSADTVYKRAKQLAQKLGATEKATRTFFDANKHRIKPTEAVEIRKGLDLLYG